MSAYAYLEQCQKLHDQVRSGKFIPSQHEAVASGSEFAFRPIGRCQLNNGSDISIGHKYASNTPSKHFPRLVHDLFITSVITDRCPQLTGMFPVFIGFTVLNSQITGLITEDVSGGNNCMANQAILKTEVAEELETAFGAWLNLDEINRSSVFNVNGQQKFLDLTPGPFDLRHYKRLHDQYQDTFDAAYSLASELDFSFLDF